MDTSGYVEYESFPQVTEAQQRVRGFYEFMNTRRTIREFESTPIEHSILVDALRTAGTAPSGANSQPWKFVVIQSAELKSQVRREAEKVEKEFYERKAPENWLEALRPLGTDAHKPYLEEAPALIAVFSQNIKGKTYYPLESTGIATGLLIAALHTSGLATLTHTPKPMYFLNELLGLDSSYKPFVLVVTGYPKLPVRVPNLNRKAIDEIAEFY